MFIRSLLPALQENKRFREAAQLVKRFNYDNKLFIKLLCDGKFYQEAIFESKHSSEPLDDIVREHLAAFGVQTVELIKADHTKFEGYVTRLQTVRKQKTEKLLNGPADDDVGDCDMFSDTTSMNSSRFTGRLTKSSGRSSHRSGKNRRKHERKLLSLKEGNQFEDIALIDALYNLTQKIFDQQQQINDLLRSIIDVELDTVGVEIQKTYENLLEYVKDSLNTIWLLEMMVPDEIKFDEVMEYAKIQNEQHYALISE